MKDLKRRYVYEDTFKIEHIENETLPVLFINTSQNPFGAPVFNTFSNNFVVNWLMIIGIVLFAVGMFLLVMKNKWGFLFIVFGIGIFIMGIIFT